MQILSLFIAPFPSLHDVKEKPQLELYALLQFAFRIANQNKEALVKVLSQSQDGKEGN
jgi:hypothetical protein